MSLNDLATRVRGITAAVHEMNSALESTVQISSQAGATFTKFPSDGVGVGGRSSGPGGGGSGSRTGGFSGASRGGGGGGGGSIREIGRVVGDAVSQAIAAGFRQQATNYGLDFRTRGVR